METPRRPRILIVDDDGDVLNVLCRLFCARDYAVLTAADGDDALDRFRRHWPDLTLLDLSMPRLDGLFVLRQIKDYRRDASVIVVSGTATEAQARLAVDEGARGFIPKPIDFARLEQAVRACVVPF